MIFKAKELPKFHRFIQAVVKEHPLYNQTKYFSELLKIYKGLRYD